MLHTVAWRHRRAEVGYWLVPPRAAAGPGGAAVELLVDWAFATPRSTGSRSPPRPRTRPPGRWPVLGFVEEGIMRARNHERGRAVDVVMLARLRK